MKRAKVPHHFRSWDRKFQDAKVPESESSREREFQGAKVPPNGTFALGSESMWEWKFQLPLALTGPPLRKNSTNLTINDVYH